MEIFGIPVIFIVIIVIWAISDYYEKEQKKKEQTTQVWNAIHTGMSKDEVREILGEPHRAWRAGVAEIWAYGQSDSDGVIRFLNEEVIAYQKPN